MELGQTVLDVRVGQGQDAIPLAQMGHRVIRIDLSSVEIEKLKNTTALQRLNIDAQVADLCTSSPTERLDIILFDGMLHTIMNTTEHEKTFSMYLDFLNTAGTYRFDGRGQKTWRAFMSEFMNTWTAGALHTCSLRVL